MPSRLPLTALLLAGGKSTRMGRDKSQIPFEGSTLVLFVRAKLAEAFEEVLVCDAQNDLHPGIGPLAGLESGLAAAKHDWCFLLACDMPFFSLDLVKRLWSEAQQGEWGALIPCGPSGREPLHALVHRRALPEIRRAIETGRFGMEQAMEQAGIRYLPWEQVQKICPDASCFANWNRPEDLPAKLRETFQESSR